MHVLRRPVEVATHSSHSCYWLKMTAVTQKRLFVKNLEIVWFIQVILILK